MDGYFNTQMVFTLPTPASTLQAFSRYVTSRTSRTGDSFFSQAIRPQNSRQQNNIHPPKFPQLLTLDSIYTPATLTLTALQHVLHCTALNTRNSIFSSALTNYCAELHIITLTIYITVRKYKSVHTILSLLSIFHTMFMYGNGYIVYNCLLLTVNCKNVYIVYILTSNYLTISTLVYMMCGNTEI